MTSSISRSQWIRACVFVATSCLMLILEWLAGRWGSFLLVPVLVPLLLTSERRSSADTRAASEGLVAAVILVFGAAALRIMLHNVADPPEWDFPFFWLNARVAFLGLDFYEPEHVLRLARATFAASDAVTSQLPFKYPPPTMLLFLPLGVFTMKTALACWYVLQSLALVLDVILLRRLFSKGAGWFGLALTAALVLVHRPVLVTLIVAQTNFLVLLMVLLYWRDRTTARSGVWLALGAMVKPLVFLVLLHPLARRQWRTLVSAILTLTAASALSVLVFGPRTFVAYFTRDPTLGVPPVLYTEAVNQSLLAVILRLSGWTSTGTAPIFHPLFLVSALVLTAITLGLVARSDDASDDWGIALTIVLSLLLYPGTLLHYGVLLLVPMLLIWERRGEIAGAGPVVAFVTLQYALAYRFTFAATALTWLLLAAASVSRPSKPEPSAR